MVIKRIFAGLFAVLGIFTAALAVHLGFTYKTENPILLTPPDVAEGKVVAMMDAVCSGNYESASQVIYGTPSLGVDREASDEVGAMIWDAFVKSLSYELVGDCHTTENGLAQKVKLTSLDIDSVTANLRERSQTLLEQRVAEASDTSEIYDENNEYREEFVMAVLHDAVIQALEEDAAQKTVELTVNLNFQNGSWWVIADNALLDAISGGVLY